MTNRFRQRLPRDARHPPSCFLVAPREGLVSIPSHKFHIDFTIVRRRVVLLSFTLTVGFSFSIFVLVSRSNIHSPLLSKRRARDRIVVSMSRNRGNALLQQTSKIKKEFYSVTISSPPSSADFLF